MKTKQRKNEAKFKHQKLIFMHNWHPLISIKEDRMTNQFAEQFQHKKVWFLFLRSEVRYSCWNVIWPFCEHHGKFVKYFPSNKHHHDHASSRIGVRAYIPFIKLEDFQRTFPIWLLTCQYTEYYPHFLAISPYLPRHCFKCASLWCCSNTFLFDRQLFLIFTAWITYAILIAGWESNRRALIVRPKQRSMPRTDYLEASTLTPTSCKQLLNNLVDSV